MKYRGFKYKEIHNTNKFNFSIAILENCKIYKTTAMKYRGFKYKEIHNNNKFDYVQY